MTKNPTCQNYVNPNEFKLQFNIYKAEKVRKDNVERKIANRAKLRAKDCEKVKEKQTKWKIASRAKLRAEDNEGA